MAFANRLKTLSFSMKAIFFKQVLCAFLALHVLCSASPLSAQDLQSEEVQQRASDLVVAVPAENESALTIDQQIEIIWKQIIENIQNKNFAAANTNLNELEKLQTKAGYTVMENYSLELLSAAEKELKGGSKEKASFLVRRALKLSANSPTVQLRSLHVADVTKVSSPFKTFLAITSSTLARYDQLAFLLRKLAYPALWALTFGALLSLAYIFVAHIPVALRSMSSMMPGKIRGIFSAPLLILLLIAPLFFGPLVTLWTWTALVLLLLPSQRWFAASCAMIVILWGVLIPIRENCSLWLADKGVQSMLRVSSGVFSQNDNVILPLLTSARPSDAAAWYTRAQVQRRSADFEGADKSFQAARHFISNSDIIEAQLGLNEFLRGNASKADMIFKELSVRGLNSAEFLFNYSKVRFDLMDTEESRELFEKANAKKNLLITDLRLREEDLGLNSPVAVGEILVPKKDILQSALLPMEGASDKADQVADQLVAGAKPIALQWAGAGLFLIFLLLGTKKGQRRTVIYYRSYKQPVILFSVLRLLPGGAAALQGQGLRCLVQCSLIIFLAMPLIKWPLDMFTLLDQLQGLQLYYVYFLLALFASLSYLGFYAYDEESAACKPA